MADATFRRAVLGGRSKNRFRHCRTPTLLRDAQKRALLHLTRAHRAPLLSLMNVNLWLMEVQVPPPLPPPFLTPSQSDRNAPRGEALSSAPLLASACPVTSVSGRRAGHRWGAAGHVGGLGGCDRRHRAEGTGVVGNVLIRRRERRAGGRNLLRLALPAEGSVGQGAALGRRSAPAVSADAPSLVQVQAGSRRGSVRAERDDIERVVRSTRRRTVLV